MDPNADARANRPAPPSLPARLLLNWAFGWSWADPVAALVIAGVAVKERVEPGGEQCDDCGLPASAGDGCADDCCTPEAKEQQS